MPVRTLTALLALGIAAAPARAQLRVRLGAGVAASSALVTDSIIEPISVGPALAPTVTVGLDGTLDSVYRVGLSLGFASSTLQSTSRSGTIDIVTVRVWEPALRLSRTLGPLDVGLRAGLQVYRAARSVGIFRDGGEVTPALGADAVLPGLRMAGARLGLGAGWSVSRFSTTTLRLAGFSGAQNVHRVVVHLTVAGGPGAR